MTTTTPIPPPPTPTASIINRLKLPLRYTLTLLTSTLKVGGRRPQQQSALRWLRFRRNACQAPLTKRRRENEDTDAKELMECGPFVYNYYTPNPPAQDLWEKVGDVDEQQCRISILDASSGHETPMLLDEWIRRGDCFVLLYSIADRKSFLHIKGFWEDVVRIKGPRGQGACSKTGLKTSKVGGIRLTNGARPRTRAKAPVVLVGNGRDDLGEEERKVKESEGMALARELRCDFWECSARTGVGVDEALYGLVRKLRFAKR